MSALEEGEVCTGARVLTEVESYKPSLPWLSDEMRILEEEWLREG